MPFSRQELAAEGGESEIAFAADHEIGHADDDLLLGFMAHLGSAEDDDEIRFDGLEKGDKFGGEGDVPDVDAKTDDARALREDRLCDFDGALIDGEFRKHRTRTQVAKVGEEASQAEGGVDVFCVERG